MLVSAVVNQETSERLRILRVTAMSKILHVCVQKVSDSIAQIEKFYNVSTSIAN